MSTIEILGFIAGTIVVASFIIKGEIKIRIINRFGAAMFIVYAALMGVWAVLAFNAALMIIHSIYLFLPKKQKENNANTIDTEQVGVV